MEGVQLQRIKYAKWGRPSCVGVRIFQNSRAKEMMHDTEAAFGVFFMLAACTECNCRGLAETVYPHQPQLQASRSNKNMDVCSYQYSLAGIKAKQYYVNTLMVHCCRNATVNVNGTGSNRDHVLYCSICLSHKICAPLLHVYVAKALCTRRPRCTVMGH